ncbi:MAG: site-specific integrase [Gammaproteobacteria bacterium]
MAIAIRKNKKTGRYVLDLRDIGGNEPTFRTKPLAEEAKRKAIAEHENSGYINPRTSPTFARLCDSFLEHCEDRVRRDEIGSGEVTNKRKAIEHLKGMELDGQPLANAIVKELHAGKLSLQIVPQIQEGRAHKTAHNILVIFKQILSFGVLAGAVNVNPGAELSLPKKSSAVSKKAKRISKEKIEAIIASAPERYRLLLKFAASTGLRAGELCVLTWDNIDFDEKIVRVVMARKKCGKLGDPKSYAGFRDINLSATLTQELREWKMAQPQQQRCRNLVFPSSTGEIASTDNWRERGVKVGCKNAGVEAITLHDFRHYFASVLFFVLDKPDATVTYLMGHSSIDFTRRTYAHWMENKKRDAKLSEEFEAAFG